MLQHSSKREVWLFVTTTWTAYKTVLNTEICYEGISGRYSSYSIATAWKTCSFPLDPLRLRTFNKTSAFQSFIPLLPLLPPPSLPPFPFIHLLSFFISQWSVNTAVTTKAPKFPIKYCYRQRGEKREKKKVIYVKKMKLKAP